MRTLVCLLCFVALLSVCVDARVPQKGDHVQVLTTSGKINVHVYEGNITDISDGLLCMNCTQANTEAGTKYRYLDEIEGMWSMDFYPPCDICIGTGQIIALIWPDDANLLRHLTTSSIGKNQSNETELSGI